MEAAEVHLNSAIDIGDQKISNINTDVHGLAMTDIDNKFNRNFILVLNTVRAYDLFSKQNGIDEFIYNYIHKIGPLAQTVFARLLLRKRIWFNQVLHLTKYCQSETQLYEAVSELTKYHMIKTDH